MFPIRSGLKGFTLLEMLIAASLISIMAGAVWLVCSVGQAAYYSQWKRSGIKAETGRAFTRMTEELHGALSMTDAQAASLEFTADTDGDGVIETIQYSWSGVAAEPLYRVKTLPLPAETFTLVNSVNDLAFSYYGDDNTALGFPVTPSQARLVSMDITSSDGEEAFHLRTKVKLECI